MQAEKEQYKQDIRDGKMIYTAITDIEVNGKISNFHGNVTRRQAQGQTFVDPVADLEIAAVHADILAAAAAKERRRLRAVPEQKTAVQPKADGGIPFGTNLKHGDLLIILSKTDYSLYQASLFSLSCPAV